MLAPFHPSPHESVMVMEAAQVLTEKETTLLVLLKPLDPQVVVSW
jgi:hypothetical protein